MAKSKYDENTFPLLAEGFARDGLNDVEIANNLGISKDTYYTYQKKYPDFLDAIRAGKKPVDIIAVNSLYKLVQGYSYKEITTETKKTKDGTTLPIVIKTVTKHIPPNERACEFWLTNRDRENWKHMNHTDLTSKGEALLTLEERQAFIKDIQDDCGKK